MTTQAERLARYSPELREEVERATRAYEMTRPKLADWDTYCAGKFNFFYDKHMLRAVEFEHAAWYAHQASILLGLLDAFPREGKLLYGDAMGWLLASKQTMEVFAPREDPPDELELARQLFG
jgi:hypothetical protein